MHPRLFTIPLPTFELFGRDIGPISVPTYGVLVALGFIAGLWIAGRQARKEGLDANQIIDLAVYVLLAGLVGARVLLVIVDWEHYWKEPADLWSLVQSAGVFYGGLLGAIPVAFWYARKHQLDSWRVADVLAPGVILGQSIGRWGCLAAGCCFGRPADVPWAVTFRDISASRRVGTPVDIPLHPTQVYESLAALLLFVVLLWLAGRKRFHGQIAVAYLLGYSVLRFVIEYWRGDSSRGDVFGGVFSTSQFIALLIFVVTLAITPYLWKNKRTAPAAA